MSSRGQIVIPQTVWERCGLQEGDHFVVEDNPATKAVILRKVKPAGEWFEVYMQCPAPFDVPARRRRLHRPKHGVVG